MWFFGRKNKVQMKNKPDQRMSMNEIKDEFERDMQMMEDPDDEQCIKEFCQREYEKARGLEKKVTGPDGSESLLRCSNLMYSLANEYSYLPAVKWCASFAEKIKKDLYQASQWHKLAADLGDAESAYVYSDMLIRGRGVEADLQEGIHYCQRSARGGSARGCLLAAELLRIKGKHSEAMTMYNTAIKHGIDREQIRERIDSLEVLMQEES